MNIRNLIDKYNPGGNELEFRLLKPVLPLKKRIIYIIGVYGVQLACILLAFYVFISGKYLQNHQIPSIILLILIILAIIFFFDYLASTYILQVEDKGKICFRADRMVIDRTNPQLYMEVPYTEIKGIQTNSGILKSIKLKNPTRRTVRVKIVRFGKPSIILEIELDDLLKFRIRTLFFTHESILEVILETLVSVNGVDRFTPIEIKTGDIH